MFGKLSECESRVSHVIRIRNIAAQKERDHVALHVHARANFSKRAKIERIPPKSSKTI
jgi:hypothetical protein